jgi:LPXTG-site transpeptidase (sortase) family protein
MPLVDSMLRVCLVSTTLMWCSIGVAANAGPAGPDGRPAVDADLTPGVKPDVPPGRGWLAYADVPPAQRTLGRIEIPRVGVSAPILEGVDDATLRRSVGHFPDTSRPDENGNMALAAHRGTDFWGLRHIRLGDEITIVTPQRSYRYVVERTWVVQPSDLSVLDPTDGRSLTLVTCFPFTYRGHAPQRFIVRARPADEASVAAGMARPEQAPAEVSPVRVAHTTSR